MVITIRYIDCEYLKGFYYIPQSPEDIDTTPIYLKKLIFLTLYKVGQILIQAIKQVIKMKVINPLLFLEKIYSSLAVHIVLILTFNYSRKKLHNIYTNK